MLVFKCSTRAFYYNQTEVITTEVHIIK